jgi:hypothetical protein
VTRFEEARNRRRSGRGEDFKMFAEDGLSRRHAGQELVGERFGESIPEVRGNGVHKSVKKI